MFSVYMVIIFLFFFFSLLFFFTDVDIFLKLELIEEKDLINFDILKRQKKKNPQEGVQERVLNVKIQIILFQTSTSEGQCTASPEIKKLWSK